MFQLSKAATFKYKIKIKQARDKGTIEEFEFTAEYRRLEQPAIKAVLELPAEKIFTKVIGGGEIPADQALWVGWVVGEIKTPDGSNLEPSADGRQALLLEPGAPQAIVNGWLEAVFYGPAKN